jgi:hypothetical protein
MTLSAEHDGRDGDQRENEGSLTSLVRDVWASLVAQCDHRVDT